MLLSPIDDSLQQLRWKSGEISPETFTEHMRTVATFPSYQLILRDGRIALAPDDERNRKLAAVFTNHGDRDAFEKNPPAGNTGQVWQTVHVTSSGPDLFRNLASMELDGIVFNPGAGDRNRMVAFQSKFASVVLQYATSESSDSNGGPQAEPSTTGSGSATTQSKPATATVAFDDLAQSAFPDGAMGSREALDALWRQLLGLDAWVFAVRQGQMDSPFATRMDNGPSVFAFTDPTRLGEFYRANDLIPAGQTDFMYLTLAPVQAIPWLQTLQAKHGLECVYFNFGGRGWFAPIRTLDGICRHLSFSYNRSTR